MHRAQVIVFQEDVDEEFPVAGHLEGPGPGAGHLLQPVGPQQLFEAFEIMAQGPCLAVGIDEDEAGGGGQRQLQEAVVGLLEAFCGPHLQCLSQAAVEPVVPAVVRALDPLAAPLAFQQAHAPMAAGVGKGAKLALGITQQDYRQTGKVNGRKVADFRAAVMAPNAKPLGPEGPVDLAIQKGRTAVAPGRQGLRPLRRQQGLVVKRRREEVIRPGGQSLWSISRLGRFFHLEI